ncbi:MAG: helix-turn-helix domain-containing protein [Nanoarchaeota archaeon]
MINKEVLKQIGLSEYESELYLALLQYGSLSAYELAKKTGMYRQATYDALNRLSEKGYVNSVKEGKSQKYKSVNPEIILEYLNERTEGFKQILPELTSLDEKAKEPLMVETYKGKNVTRIALRDIINRLKEKGGEVLCTAVDESIPLKGYETIIEQYERDMINYGIKERVIIKEGSKGIFKNKTSKYKQIQEKFFNSNPVQIYGDNVQIIVWGNPDYLIIIRSRDVAESYKKQFELLWQIAKS